MTNSKSLSKQEIETKIKDIFSKNPSSNEIKKIKKLAMSKNLKLKQYRKLFCKKCLTFFNSNNSEIRIKNGFKRIKCENCDFISRYKI
jgi:RNase P subunit RPR2